MRILYVNDAIAIIGGLERILVEKVNELTERYGYDICLVTANQGQHPLPYELHPRVTFCDLGIQFHQQYRVRGVRRLWTRYMLYRRFISRLRQQIRQFAPDVIVCVRTNYMADVLKASGNVPVVFESHTSRYDYNVRRLPWHRRLMLRHWLRAVGRARCVVTLTAGDAKAWEDVNPRTCVIPNLVHLNTTGRYSDCNAQSAIFVGRFSEQKDVHTLLQIWTLVHRRHPDWVLNILGGYGEEQEALLPAIREMGDSVQLHEPTPHIFEQYLQNSMLLLTSVYEPFGLVLPEAMSCGLPVVSFDCPFGPSDIITDGEDGFLIANRSVSDFADKVCLLIEQPDRRRAMGKAGIASAQRYHASRIMPQWQAFFHQFS